MADALEVEIKQLYDDWIANPSAVVCARLADRLRLAGRIGEALDVAARGLEEWPVNAQINLVCARCRRESGETALALESFQKVLATDPMNLIALRAVGEIAFEQQRYADAERLLGDYLFENPADPEAEKLLARAKEMRSTPPAPAAAAAEVVPGPAPDTAPGAAVASVTPSEALQEPLPAESIPVPAPQAEEAGVEPSSAEGQEQVQVSTAEAVVQEAIPAFHAPSPAPPADVPLFTPIVALAEPAEPAVPSGESPSAPAEPAGTVEQPSEPPFPPSAEDVLAGAFGSFGTGPMEPPGRTDTPSAFEASPPGSVFAAPSEPPSPVMPEAAPEPSAAFDWIRSAAGLAGAPAAAPEPPGPEAAEDAAVSGGPEEELRDAFPRTDRMERIIEAQTSRQAPPAELPASTQPSPAAPAPVEEPPAAPPAPPDHSAHQKPQPHPQRQAMPRREPRSLLDLFGADEREELGLEQFRLEEQ